MKKLYCLLLVAVLVLTAACAAMAEDSKPGPEIYVDYGLGGTDDLSQSSSRTAEYKKTGFGQMVIGAEYPLSRWNFGVEYAWANDYQLEDLNSSDLKGDSSLLLLKAGYQVLNVKQFQLYVNGVYAQNAYVMKNSSGEGSFDTKGLLIGPEVRYTINDKLNVRGFFGYGVHVAQTVTEGASMDLDDESMTFLNVKLTYLFRDHWAVALGYRIEEIKSGLETGGSDTNFTYKQDMLTVGAAYQF